MRARTDVASVGDRLTTVRLTFVVVRGPPNFVNRPAASLSLFQTGFRCTRIGYKVVPRFRESRLLVPSGAGAEFTQPRAHILADPCIIDGQLS